MDGFDVRAYAVSPALPVANVPGDVIPTGSAGGTEFAGSISAPGVVVASADVDACDGDDASPAAGDCERERDLDLA